jgi:hypothetical protein
VTVVGEEFVFALTASAAATVNLPTATAGRKIVVIDRDGNAAANNVTVNPSGGALIDGAASAVINTNRCVLRLVGNGTNWFSW